MTLYLLQRENPSDGSTHIVGVYSTRKKAEVAKQTFLSYNTFPDFNIIKEKLDPKFNVARV